MTYLIAQIIGGTSSDHTKTTQNTSLHTTKRSDTAHLNKVPGAEPQKTSNATHETYKYIT